MSHHVLRVAICGCMKMYHGQLVGRKIHLDGRTFELHEVRIPDDDRHAKPIKQSRSHFFIDNTVQPDRSIWTSLMRNDLIVSASGRSERWYYFVYDGMRVAAQERQGKPDHPHMHLTPSGMAQLIRRILTWMDSRERRLWLARMR